MRKKTGLVLIALVYLSIIVLIQVDNIGAYFIRDDAVLIHAFHDKGPAFFARLFVEDYVKYIWPGGFEDAWAGKGFIRPLLMLSIKLDYLLYGTNPIGYHWTNILLHLLNSLLVFAIIRVITGETLLGFAASLLFVVNPAHSEAVSWISGRSESLAAVFYLSSFLSFLYFRSRNVRNYYFASLILFLLSLFAKETPAIFPFLLVSYDLIQSYFQRRNGIQLLASIKETIRHRYFSWIPYFAILAVWFLIRRITLGDFIGAYGGHTQVDPAAKFFIMVSALRYVLLASPFNHLDKDVFAAVMGFTLPQPMDPLQRVDWLMGPVYCALLLLLLFVGAANLRYRRLLFIAGVWGFFTYLPVFLNVYVAAFYLYLFVPAVCIGLVALLFSILSKRTAMAAVLFLSMIYAGYQYKYSGHWAQSGAISKMLKEQIEAVAASSQENDTIILLDLPTRYRTSWTFEDYPEAILRKPLASADLTDRFYVKSFSTQELQSLMAQQPESDLSEPDKVRELFLTNTDSPYLLKYEPIRSMLIREGKGMTVSTTDWAVKIKELTEQRPSQSLHIIKWNAQNLSLERVAVTEQLINQATP